MAAGVSQGSTLALLTVSLVVVIVLMTLSSSDYVSAKEKSPRSADRIFSAGPVLQRYWGDVTCSDTIDSEDALGILRNKAGLPVLQGVPCPDIGADVLPGIWGDVDCDGDLDAIDALKVLRYVAGLPVFQNEPCPDIGIMVALL